MGSHQYMHITNRRLYQFHNSSVTVDMSYCTCITVERQNSVSFCYYFFSVLFYIEVALLNWPTKNIPLYSAYYS